jgi:hypothetical protein
VEQNVIAVDGLPTAGTLPVVFAPVNHRDVGIAHAYACLLELSGNMDWPVPFCAVQQFSEAASAQQPCSAAGILACHNRAREQHGGNRTITCNGE